VGAARDAAEQRFHLLRKSGADAQSDQLAVGVVGAAAGGPGRLQGTGAHVADRVVVVDGQGQRHAMHEFAGRHRRPRAEGHLLALFIAQRGFDFEQAILQAIGAADDLPRMHQFAFSFHGEASSLQKGPDKRRRSP